MALTFHQHQLPNGLDVVAEINPDSHSIAVGMFVKTGARDEEVNINGVSHFLEHMMFKGSEKYTWEDVNRIFDEMGARYNAFTSQEMTAYYANVLPEFTERAVEHLAHLLRPAIRQSDFDTEKKVILEEIAMYLDEPGHKLYEMVMQEHFEGHPLALSVLGPAESIQKLERDQMHNYFTTRYGPGNMVLAATGRVDFPELVKLAEKYCGQWPHVNAARVQPCPQHGAKRKLMTDPKLNRYYTMAMTPGPSARTNAALPPASWPTSSATPTAAASTGLWSTTPSPRRPTSASIPTTPAAASTSTSSATPTAPTKPSRSPSLS